MKVNLSKRRDGNSSNNQWKDGKIERQRVPASPMGPMVPAAFLHHGRGGNGIDRQSLAVRALHDHAF
jgi:hypothetical protein